MSNDIPQQNYKGRSYILTLLLAIFTGMFGIHRFYTGYLIIGLIQLITGGGFGLWVMIDVISIALNKYKDAEGNELINYNPGCGLIALVIIIVSFIIGGLSAVTNLLTMFKG